MSAREGAATAPGQAALADAWEAQALKCDEAAELPGLAKAAILEQATFAAQLRDCARQLRAVAAAAAAQPADLRDLAAEVIAAYEASISYDETPRDRSRIAGWRARLAAAAQPAPGGVLLSDHLRERGRPGVAAMVEAAETLTPSGFTRWLESQYPDGRGRFEGYGGGDMRDAYEAGRQAAEQPAPALNLPGEALAADNHKLRTALARVRAVAQAAARGEAARLPESPKDTLARQILEELNEP